MIVDCPNNTTALVDAKLITSVRQISLYPNLSIIRMSDGLEIFTITEPPRIQVMRDMELAPPNPAA